MGSGDLNNIHVLEVELLNSEHKKLEGWQKWKYFICFTFNEWIWLYLKFYRNVRKRNPSYLLVNICDESIVLMRHVFCAFLEELEESIRVHSTPENSQIFQLTCFNIFYIHVSIFYIHYYIYYYILLSIFYIHVYIRRYKPVEYFVKFIFSHGAKNRADTLLNFPNGSTISLLKSRRHLHDKASDISGCYAGLQVWISQLNEFAICVPICWRQHELKEYKSDSLV